MIDELSFNAKLACNK